MISLLGAYFLSFVAFVCGFRIGLKFRNQEFLDENQEFLDENQNLRKKTDFDECLLCEGERYRFSGKLKEPCPVCNRAEYLKLKNKW
jgi:hypothetical protein